MCGVFGIRSVERDVARLSYFALFALQHRGQESAGIAVSEGGRLTVLRDMGLVAQVFNEQQLQALPGEVAIGHLGGGHRHIGSRGVVGRGRAAEVEVEGAWIDGAGLHELEERWPVDAVGPGGGLPSHQ